MVQNTIGRIIFNEWYNTLAFTAIQQCESCISTLYSGVPGDKLLIFDPSWTNMWVMVAIREWRSLYSSYSAQKSSWYLWRCSKLMMGPYVLQDRHTDTLNDDVTLTGSNHPGYISPWSHFFHPLLANILLKEVISSNPNFPFLLV